MARSSRLRLWCTLAPAKPLLRAALETRALVDALLGRARGLPVGFCGRMRPGLACSAVKTEPSRVRPPSRVRVRRPHFASELKRKTPTPQSSQRRGRADGHVMGRLITAARVSAPPFSSQKPTRKPRARPRSASTNARVSRAARRSGLAGATTHLNAAVSSRPIAGPAAQNLSTLFLFSRRRMLPAHVPRGTRDRRARGSPCLHEGP
jgi:hypothetical protein